MKKTKRALMSMIVFLTVFYLTTIFDMQSPLTENESATSNTKDALLTQSEALDTSIDEIGIKSFSYSTPSPIPYALGQSKTAIMAGFSEDYLTLAESTPSAKMMDLSEEETQVEPIDAHLPTEPEAKKPAPEALYANIGISVAESFVNIREEASTESSILGKLYRDSAAKILETQGEWYKVESGSVKGYVSSDYIKTGIPDEEIIEKYSVLRIAVAVDGLNVRKETSTESEKLTVIYQNEIYPVIETKGDWIKIEIADENVAGYIKTEFVKLLVDFNKAISKEEEQEIEQLKAEAAAKKETEIKYQDGVSYSDADLKLLACLVHAEAGTQSYEGKLAVANIVLNRVKSSKYADTIKGVIYQSGQFTVAASGSLAKQLANYNNYNSNSQRLSIKAAKAALGGANNVGSRLYFHSYSAAVREGHDNKSNCVKVDDQLFW